MAQEPAYGQRKSPPMTPEEREVAVRTKAAELQPNAEPDMQLILYAEVLLDAILYGRSGAGELFPENWRRRAS